MRTLNIIEQLLPCDMAIMERIFNFYHEFEPEHNGIMITVST